MVWQLSYLHEGRRFQGGVFPLLCVCVRVFVRMSGRRSWGADLVKDDGDVAGAALGDQGALEQGVHQHHAARALPEHGTQEEPGVRSHKSWQCRPPKCSLSPSSLPESKWLEMRLHFRVSACG